MLKQSIVLSTVLDAETDRTYRREEGQRGSATLLLHTPHNQYSLENPAVSWHVLSSVTKQFLHLPADLYIDNWVAQQKMVNTSIALLQ